MPEPAIIPNAAAAAETVQPQNVRQSRRIALLGGRLEFDAAIFPIIGAEDVEYIIAHLIDRLTIRLQFVEAGVGAL